MLRQTVASTGEGWMCVLEECSTELPQAQRDYIAKQSEEATFAPISRGHVHLSSLVSQGNTPWVAPACADCPGFLVLGSAPAPASTLVSEPRIVPPG